jgi:SecD/SecF fusion protein
MILSSPVDSKGNLTFKITLKNFERLSKEFEKSQGLDLKNFRQDAKSLFNLLASMNFRPLKDASSQDLVFELNNFAEPIFKILNEKEISFKNLTAFLPAKSYSELNRYLNQMDDKYQSDLVLWQDSFYETSQRYEGKVQSFITPPKQNLVVSNLLLSAKKLLRGDNKNTIKFGLDLSGGKNVLIELLDHSGKKITAQEDIKQSINELYDRVNKLGISDVAIRQEGDFISLDFPGSQNLSASELVSGSSMQFHVVNEEFSTLNPQHAEQVEAFLKEVWDKVSQSKKQDSQTIQNIAYNTLNQSKSLACVYLKENGLRLANPAIDLPSSNFDKTLSKVAYLKTDKANSFLKIPLMIVFNNFALEGVALKNIGISYDPAKGNFLNFSVSSEMKRNNASFNPQESFHTWTSAFSKKGMKKEDKAFLSKGSRMAVILNGEIVNAPFLESGLKESASITGSFTQKELLKLKNDLQAGSLSFQPKIIMENNVAPELGLKDKNLGLTSMLISLVLVSFLMIYYYRFSGIVATIALIINLLMLIAACVYFNTTLSLASIAGIVLTLGMAVDANILVFERVREELKKNISLKDALYMGYQKAFTAIIDSNLTTMIAAVVLLSFNSGPVKGFALTLLVGLVTSVFTALFMTKTYFLNWVQKTKFETLKFSSWIANANFNFLSHVKKAMVLSICTILCGAFALSAKKSEFFGMDFKGGFSIDLPLESVEKKPLNHEVVANCFIKQGIKPSQISVRAQENNTFKVFFDKDVEEFKSQHESWTTLISSALDKNHLSIKGSNATDLDNLMTKVSGQLSDSMRNQALIGLSIALAAIFVYIVIRFEWAYALAATIGLVHDVLFSCALMFILASLNVPVIFDMTAIAAILTIIGYSLNDTIIVFDRVREERKHNPNKPLHDVVQSCLNTTLSRTMLTSLTTLIVLVPMVILGNGALFNFSCIMTIGVIFGTLSTWYLASPLLLKFIKEKN